MKNFLFFIFLSMLSFLLTSATTYAARMVLVAPEFASTNGEPFTVSVYIDSEGQKISAVSGELTFNSDLLTIDTITTRNSVVSLWINQPKIDSNHVTEGTATISFEGIIPGGYDGVRSPYYKEKNPGLVFLVAFRPKKEGDSVIQLHNTQLHLLNAEGSIVPTHPQIAHISIPHQSIVYSPVYNKQTKTTSNTLDVSIKRNTLIANNAWYVDVNEDQSIRPTQHIFVAESREYTPEAVVSNFWKEINGIYVLENQLRTKYVHIKVEYQNNTFTYVTLAPVENSPLFIYSSRILSSIVGVLMLLLLYRYGSFIAKFF
jgi:hypothetical protein